MRSAFFTSDFESLFNSEHSFLIVFDVIQSLLLGSVVALENQFGDWVLFMAAFNIFPFDHNVFLFVCKGMKFDIPTLELCTACDMLFGIVDDFCALKKLRHWDFSINEFL